MKITPEQFKMIWKQRVKTGAVFVMSNQAFLQIAPFLKNQEAKKML